MARHLRRWGLTCLVECLGPSLASSHEPVAREGMHRACQDSHENVEDAREIVCSNQSIRPEARSITDDSRARGPWFDRSCPEVDEHPDGFSPGACPGQGVLKPAQRWSHRVARSGSISVAPWSSRTARVGRGAIGIEGGTRAVRAAVAEPGSARPDVGTLAPAPGSSLSRPERCARMPDAFARAPVRSLGDRVRSLGHRYGRSGRGAGRSRASPLAFSIRPCGRTGLPTRRGPESHRRDGGSAQPVSRLTSP
jgi:hypothetical protein